MVRAHGKTAYCFIENLYEGEKVAFADGNSIEASMQSLENLPLSDPLIQKIFHTDITGEREAENFVLVLPAGISGHVEAGIAYGLGKHCYVIGQPEKTETLYGIFDEIFPDLSAFEAWLGKQK